jgi:hypothetical protein
VLSVTGASWAFAQRDRDEVRAEGCEPRSVLPRPWVSGLGTAAASRCVALVAVGVMIGRAKTDRPRPPRPATTKRQHLVGFPNCVCTQSCVATCACSTTPTRKAERTGGQRDPTGCLPNRPPPKGKQRMQPARATIVAPQVTQPNRSGRSLSAKVLLGNLISGS